MDLLTYMNKYNLNVARLLLKYLAAETCTQLKRIYYEGSPFNLPQRSKRRTPESIQRKSPRLWRMPALVAGIVAKVRAHCKSISSLLCIAVVLLVHTSPYDV